MKEQFLTECIVLDTETTDIDYSKAEITEYGYVIRNLGNPLQWESFDYLYKPHTPITPENSAITNITNRMVEDKPHFEDDIEKVTSVLDAFRVYVAHNSFYDRKVLENYDIHRGRWLCTLDIARKLYHDDSTVTAHNLPYLRYRFEILDPADYQIAAHRADSDALVTAHLLEIMVTEMEERGILTPGEDYYSAITAWLEEPIIYTTMPFGKHKGKNMSDVPLDYWQWALDKMDTLNEEHEKYDRHFAASVMAAIESKL